MGRRIVLCCFAISLLRHEHSHCCDFDVEMIYLTILCMTKIQYLVELYTLVNGDSIVELGFRSFIHVVSLWTTSIPFYLASTRCLPEQFCSIEVAEVKTMRVISNLHYTRGITLKRVMSGRIQLRGLAPGQHSSEKTLQR